MKKIIILILMLSTVGCQAKQASPEESSEFDCEANKFSLQMLDSGIFDYCAGGVLNQPEQLDENLNGTWHFDSDDYQLWTITNSTIAIFYQGTEGFVAKVGVVEVKDGEIVITTQDDNEKEVIQTYSDEISQGEVVGTNEDGDVYSTHLNLFDEDNQELQAIKSIGYPFDPTVNE